MYYSKSLYCAGAIIVAGIVINYLYHHRLESDIFDQCMRTYLYQNKLNSATHIMTFLIMIILLLLGLRLRQKDKQRSSSIAAIATAASSIRYLETFTIHNYNPRLWCQVGCSIRVHCTTLPHSILASIMYTLELSQIVQMNLLFKEYMLPELNSIVC